MKSRIDLKKAAEAEAFGALAVSAKRKHHREDGVGRHSTPAQNRALYHLVHSLVQVARQAGAEHKRVTVGDVSLKLREHKSGEAHGQVMEVFVGKI